MTPGMHFLQGCSFQTAKPSRGDSLILAAGGCSYTSTGSDGDGYRLARSVGHSIKPPVSIAGAFYYEGKLVPGAHGADSEKCFHTCLNSRKK